MRKKSPTSTEYGAKKLLFFNFLNIHKRPIKLNFPKKYIVGTHMGSKATPPTFNVGLITIIFYLPHTRYAAKNQKTMEIRGQMLIFFFYSFQVPYPDGFA
jgi:hypothetical protein